MNGDLTEKNGESQIISGANLSVKLEWLQLNAQSNTSYTIEVYNDERINIQYQSLFYSGRKNITIILKGMESARTISPSSNGCLFIIGSGVTLILDSNIVLRGRNNNTHPLVTVEGTFIMNSRTAIIGNKNTAGDFPCGGVFVLEDGVFNLNGGTISKNVSSNVGGGVAVDGIFNMNSGIISENTAEDGGGGVFTQGTFIMNHGVISGNASRMGGGVVVKGTFTMNEGTIANNIVEAGGGGVAVTGTFTMKGGDITSNTTKGELGCGGGVAVIGTESDAVFIKSGGIITGFWDDEDKGNVVRNNDGDFEIGMGHAIFASSSFHIKMRETTIEASENISYNAVDGVTTGTWDEKKSESEKTRSTKIPSIIGAILGGFLVSAVGNIIIPNVGSIFGLIIGSIIGWIIGKKAGEKIMNG